jgi:hypothetical protein
MSWGPVHCTWSSVRLPQANARSTKGTCSLTGLQFVQFTEFCLPYLLGGCSAQEEDTLVAEVRAQMSAMQVRHAASIAALQEKIKW